MEKEEFLKLITGLSISFRIKTDENTIGSYYEFLKDKNSDLLKQTFKEIIKKNKYFPSIAEILKEYEIQEKNRKYVILEIMKEKGYFKESEYGISEYDKACRWIETGIIPNWFVEDMKKYYNATNKTLFTNNIENLRLEVYDE